MKKEIQMQPDEMRAKLREIGISPSYAHELVSGARMPSFSLARRIAREAGIPLEYWSERA